MQARGVWTWCLASSVLLAAGCAADGTPQQAAPSPTEVPASTAPSTTATAAATSTPATTAPATAPPVDPKVLAGITATSVPPDVIVPTSTATLDKVTNPINGRRSREPRDAEKLDCATCPVGLLDQLGFDVTSGSTNDQAERKVQRSAAVVQLDAGLPMTGQFDAALRDYVAKTPETEVRQIGRSAQGRPILAERYGTGPTTVLAVGQTHGDEEGGLRVLLRARSEQIPAGMTLWMIPTANPDGLAMDTRFLADGADPNRYAPAEPEQRAVYDFALAIRPQLTVWYHQNYGWVGGSGASMAPAQQYQALTGLGTLKRSGNCALGFLWCPIDHALGASSILVELPDVLTPADVQRHARALLQVAEGRTR